MERALAFSDHIERALAGFARAAGALFLVLTAVICGDVVTRKLGYQLPGFGSTRLQELEWHLHGAIFILWIGYAYIRNAHIRIDLALTRATPRTHALLELVGIVLFALPFSLVALWFSIDYAWIAWTRLEGSTSPSGLPYRFVLKGILSFGLALLLLSVLAIGARVIVHLLGPAHLRERSAFAGVKTRTDG